MVGLEILNYFTKRHYMAEMLPANQHWLYTAA